MVQSVDHSRAGSGFRSELAIIPHLSVKVAAAAKTAPRGGAWSRLALFVLEDPSFAVGSCLPAEHPAQAAIASMVEQIKAGDAVDRQAVRDLAVVAAKAQCAGDPIAIYVWRVLESIGMALFLGQDARARCDVHLESAHHIAGDVAVWAVAAHSQRALVASRWSRIAADDEHDAKSAALRAAWEKIVAE